MNDIRVFLLITFFAIVQVHGDEGFKLEKTPQNGKTEDVSPEEAQVFGDQLLARALALVEGGGEEQMAEAAQLLENTAIIFSIADNKGKQAFALGQLGLVMLQFNEFESAIAAAKKGIGVAGPVGEKFLLAKLHQILSSAYSNINQFEQAADSSEEASKLLIEIGDTREAALTLNDLALAYESIGRRELAIDSRKQAISLLGGSEPAIEMATKSKIGASLWYLGRATEALDYYEQVLNLAREKGDVDWVSTSLNCLGEVYNTSFSDHSKALELFNSALKFRKDSPDRDHEGLIFNNIGTVYMESEEPELAMEYFLKARDLLDGAESTNVLATVLSNLGSTNISLGKNSEGIQFLEEALELRKAEKSLAAINYRGAILEEIGGFYARSGDIGRAIPYLAQAFSIARVSGDRRSGYDTLFSLSWAALKNQNKALASIFLKLTANSLQGVRSGTRGVDPSLQRTLLQRYESAFRGLKGIAISDGDFELAVQLSYMHNDQRFFDSSISEEFDLIALNSFEAEFSRLLEERAVVAGESLVAFETKRLGSRTGVSDGTGQKELEQSLEAAEARLSELVSFLVEALQTYLGEKRQTEKVTQPTVKRMRKVLVELSQDSVQRVGAVFPLIGSEECHIVFLGPDGKIECVELESDPEELKTLAFQFYGLLQSPELDPNVVGNDLYSVLISPIERLLVESKIDTIVWHLEDFLRYIPMGALYDGERYLFERYCCVLSTRADAENLLEPGIREFVGVGFGCSKTSHLTDSHNDVLILPEIPGVVNELEGIFGSDDEMKGPIGGKVFLNAEFSKAAFFESFDAKNKIVHIASHFVFQPGDDLQSFLLLGDESFITLRDLSRIDRLFSNVDLLTLSACNSAAVRPNPDGREIDGFSELAQRLGASSVLATLWQVADNATPLLMNSFYGTLVDGSSKSKALQGAQLSLLNGTIGAEFMDNGHAAPRSQKVKIEVIDSGEASPVVRSERGIQIVEIERPRAPKFEFDDKKPFSHPYYWSPFVLFGNWQ